MALSVGTKLGPYEIAAPLGAGGMGEVYRARDAKLGRDVALKVLPEAFARDADRMARFEREARVLASLDHTNIASIYGLEDSGSTHALVMALVEGPTLAERIRSGPIPIDEALRIAKQICDALEYAHEHGIVHRDLKPANVKVTNEDAVKILDFGLAKAIEGDAASIDIGASPTISRMATQAGILLGTAAYMSPEQAKGKSIDRRADIWAFGCVLYEMLTGRLAFHGETVTDTLAAVIKEEPDWSQLPAATPIRVRVLLQRCLRKDPKERLRDIGDARISISEVLAGTPDAALAGAPNAAPLWRRALPWALFCATAIAVVALGWTQRRAANTLALVEPMRFQIPPPAKGTMIENDSYVLSPDGRELAFFAISPDGVERLWIRDLGSLETRPLIGSEVTGEVLPFFWSPDSRFIAFWTDRKLKKISISGGPAETICDLPAGAVGGSWNRAGVIVFGQAPGALMRVSADGGTASPVTTVRPPYDVAHVFPSFLPDGRHFIYLRASSVSGKDGIYVGSLDAKPENQDSNRLLATGVESDFVPSSDSGSGYLLFIRDGVLLAQPFDARGLALSGEPVAVAEHVGTFRTRGLFSASSNGVLVYKTTDASGAQLTWLDRQGMVVGTGGQLGSYFSLALSPDGGRAVVSQFSSLNPRPLLWLLDFSRVTRTQFTFGASDATSAVWSPDGSRIVFSSVRDGKFDLYEKPASGVKDEELLLKSGEDKIPTSWSRDGRFLLFTATDSDSRYEIWALPLEGNKKPFPFLHTEFDNDDGRFSPDGRWIAYSSDESGRDEIYVRAFSPDSAAAASDAGGKWLISTGGGIQPRWRGDAKELYYLAPDGKLMAADIATNPVFRAGPPRALFQAPPGTGGMAGLPSWDLTPDGNRFLFLAPAEQATQAQFMVVLNWQAGLK